MKKIGLALYSYLRNKYEISNRDTKEKFKYQIEMDSGEPINIKGFRLPYEISNQICTRYLVGYQKLFNLFAKQFDRIGITLYYILMIINLSIIQTKQILFQKILNSAGDYVIYLLPLIMHFCLQLLKILYYDYYKNISDQIVNNRGITKFRRLRIIPEYKKDRQSLDRKSVTDKSSIYGQANVGKKGGKEKVLLYDNCPWNKLEVGDLVYLKRNETAPADMLLLDVSDELLQINVQNSRGSTIDHQKQPTQLTRLKNNKHRPNGFDYKKILTGIIEYELIQDGKMRGYIKLKKDPKGEYFDQNNIIYREEQLRTCQYAICIVLFAGNLCQCFNNIKRSEKKSFFVQKSRMFFGLTFLISLILTIVSWLVASLQICVNNQISTFDGFVLAYYLTQYVRTLPIYFYICVDLIELFNARAKKRSFCEDINDKPFPKKQVNDLGGDLELVKQITFDKNINYQQINPASIGDIVMTEFVCFDKTGTMTTGEFKIKSLLVEDNCIYRFSYKSFHRKEWQLFKDNFLMQLKEHPDEEDMKSEDPQMEDRDKERKKGTAILRMNIFSGTYKGSMIKLQKQHSQQADLRQSIHSQELGSMKNAVIQNVDENIIENLRPEDLDDTHCRITVDLKSHKPKPFFNKSLHLNVSNSQLLQQNNSPPQSPLEEMQLINQSSFKDDSRSLCSDKFKKRSDSDATKKAIDDAMKYRRQVSNKKFSVPEKSDEEVQLDYLDEQEFYQKMMQGTTKIAYQEAVLALILCQEVISRFSHLEDQFINDSTQNVMDQELIKFAAQLDIKFVCANESGGKINYLIELNSEMHEFQILAINSERANHPRLGVLVQFPEKVAELFKYSTEELSPDNSETQSPCILFVREEINTLPAYIDTDKITREYWDKVFSRLHMSGMRTVVYSKLHLKEKDKNDFLDRYSQLQFQNQDELVYLFNEIEKDMAIIEVAGIKESIRKDIKPTISSLRQADLSMFILSGDELSRVLPIAYKSGLLSQNDSIINFEYDSPHSAKLNIKNQLSIMSQQIKSSSTAASRQHRVHTQDKFKSVGSVAEDHIIENGTLKGSQNKKQIIQMGEIKSYSILLSGESLTVIMQDQFLYSHFCFILYFCTTLVAYRLNAQQKASLIKIIQSEFQGNKRVLSVGDAFNDSAMFQQANVGVQYTHTIKPQSSAAKFQGRKKVTHRLSQMQSNKFIDNPLKKIHTVKDIQIIPTADLVIDTFDKLCGVVFFESRVFAEVFDDLLVFSFYRSLLLNYIIFFIYSSYCTQNPVIIESQWLVIYQSLVLFFQQLASLGSKLQRQYSGESQIHVEQFKHNVKIFKKKKILSFIFKINGNAMLDAGLLYLTLQALSIDVNGFGNAKQQVLFLLLCSDIVKLMASVQFQKITWALLFLAYFIIWLMLALLSIINNYELTIETFSHMFTNITDLFTIFFFILVQYVLSYSIEAVQPLFCQSIITNTQDYMEILMISKNFMKMTPQRKYHNLIKRIAVLAGKLFKSNKDEIDISLQDMVSGSNIKVNQDKLNSITLRFMNKETEMKFKRLAKITWLHIEKQKVFGSLLLFELMSLILYMTYHYHDLTFDNTIVIYVLSISLQLLIQFAVHSSIYSKHFFFINSILVFIRFATKVCLDFIVLEEIGLFNILISQIYIVVILFSRTHMPIINFTLALLSIIGFLRKYSSFQFINQNYTSFQILNADIIVSVTCILFMALQYQIIKLEREDFMLSVTLNQETAQMNNLLSILLPKFIRDRINLEGKYDIQISQNKVVVLFMDICQFDNIVATEKEGIVRLLDQLFRAFDTLCAQNGMQKIETVGKTYMAAGGLTLVDHGSKFQNHNPIRRAVNLAQEMMEYTKKFKFGQVGNLIIKIGVHYGQVIAGVIGHHKPQFSLIGDTVNTTSRVCSTGLDGMVILSEQAYSENPMPDLVFIQRVVNAKGKGDLTTYQLSNQIQRGKQKFKKKQAFILSDKNLPPQLKPVIHQSSIQHQGSVDQNLINPYQQSSHNAAAAGDQSSKSITVDNIESKQFVEPRLSRQRRQNKGPTLVLRNINRENAPPPHSIFKIQSNNNIIVEGLGNKEESQSNLIKEDSFTDKQNVLLELSQKLRKDINVEIVEDFPEYEIEYEKVKLQFEEDQNQIDTEGLQLEKSKFYLGFKDNQYELAKEFLEEKTQGRNIIFVSMSLHILQFLIKTLSFLIVADLNFTKLPYFTFGVRMFALLSMLVLALLQNKKQKQRFYQEEYFIAVYGLLLVSILIEFILLESKFSYELQASEGILLICFFCSLSIVQIKYKVYFIFGFCIAQILIVLIKFDDQSVAYYTVFLSFLMFLVVYSYFVQDLNTFNNRRQLQQKRAQCANLVKYLLPNHILQQFLSDPQRMVLIDSFEDATLLFADIAGFTEYSSRVEPAQVVNMLRNLFTEFDKSCLLKNCYKLYTIGDCYVVFGIVDTSQRNPAQEAKNVVDLGFKMIEIIREVRTIIGFDGLDMRIGAHTGRVIGGILGTEIVRYDIYGADVMISNKMESNGEKGKIHISEETKILLESQFAFDYTFTYNKPIVFSSIQRETKGYFVDQVKGDSNSGFQSSLNRQSIAQNASFRS